MDEFTKDHLIAWATKHVGSDERYQFVSFAAYIFEDEDDAAHYMDAGWQRLYDRFYDERVATT